MLEELHQSGTTVQVTTKNQSSIPSDSLVLSAVSGVYR